MSFGRRTGAQRDGWRGAEGWLARRKGAGTEQGGSPPCGTMTKPPVSAWVGVGNRGAAHACHADGLARMPCSMRPTRGGGAEDMDNA